MNVDVNPLMEVRGAAESPPAADREHMGWVRTALRNALWQVPYARNLEEAVVDTVGRGGYTDTNAATREALPGGAVSGLYAIPARWSNTVLNRGPDSGPPHVHRRRPERYCPVDM